MKSLLSLLGLLLVCGTPKSNPEKWLKEAKVTLPEAVAEILPQVKPGTPIAARLAEEKGRVLFQISVAQGESGVRLSIDAKTLEVTEKTPLKKNYTKLVGAAKVTFAKAVEVAIHKVPGKATRVGFGLKKGKPIIEVKVWKDGKLSEVEIDGITGSVLKVDDDDDEDDDGDDDDDDDDDD
jgi:uncharacterized membrane protein YkoI